MDFHAIDGVGAASVIAENLNFVASAKIEAAVGFIGDHKFELHSEVPEFLVGDKVVTVKIFVGGIFENAVFDGPTVATVRMTNVPAGGVFAVEERAEAVFV